jgi:AcrR family transcriptional regulator
MATRKKALDRPRKAPSQVRSHHTVDALLEATARILVTRGWVGLTTNHVAVRAGVSVGTLYEWFPSKEALVAAVVDRHLEHAEAHLRAKVATLTPRITMPALSRALATVMVELHEDDPRLHRALTEEIPHPPATRARIAALEHEMVTALSSVLRARGIERPVVAAKMIVLVLESATHRWATGEDGSLMARATLVGELAFMIAGYLKARAA